MGKIYTGIDIGTNSIKIVVAEKINDKFKVLAAEEVKSEGIKRSVITDIKKVATSVSKAIQEIEKILGIKLKKVVVCIPSQDSLFDIVSSKINVQNELCITGEDINNLLKDAIGDKIKTVYELVSAMPINFKLDDNKLVKDPKGLSSKTIEARIVITEVPRKNLYNLLNVLEICGLEVIDITLKTIADYFEVKNKRLDSEVGAIINIGEDTTNVSIYNKGIMIKNSIINVGSYYVDHDFTYIYKIDLAQSRKLKETFALASTRYADKYDDITVDNEVGEKQTINQLEITQIAEARIAEILKIAKKEIKTLTNRQISYIIILGGLSEMTGFQYIAENILGEKATVWNSTTIGIRHNKYTSALGIIKYFDDKLTLRDRNIEMFDTEDINKLISINKKEKDNAIINKMFGQFLGN
mgnify:CR=1 FL=1